MNLETMELHSGPGLEELLEVAKTINAKSWFEARKNDDPEFYEIETDPFPENKVAPNDDIIAHLNVLTGQPYPEVFLCVVPASESWMVPCYLHIGNWNDVPRPEEHSAIFKYWLEKYGATVACIANDVIEFTVKRPPATQEAALELAREQFVYCPDIVYQGAGSLEMLAATLLHASVWYFWWD